MLMVDMPNSTARIGLADLRASGAAYCTNPERFAAFWETIELTPGMLLEPGWRDSGSAAAGFPYFAAVMHGVVPRACGVRALEALDGRFALRITGAGDYTVIAMNRRVVTLAGLPADDATGEVVLDAEIRADAFMALCNDLLADLAEATLQRIVAARRAAA